MSIPTPHYSGKIRDIYDLGDTLLLVATDRISAYDHILPSLIPDKGRILTGISEFWFNHLNTPNHLITTTIPEYLPKTFIGRSMIVRKANVIPFEMIVRGYLTGSAWSDYQNYLGYINGIQLPPGLLESDQITPIFTPTTKATTGHDTPVSFDSMANAIGIDTANAIRTTSINIYNKASAYVRDRGLILADTKFEFGHDIKTDKLLLIDEVLTPDSSRYWALDNYKPGAPQPSYDKQYVRDWIKTNWKDNALPPPELPQDIISGTRTRYIEAYERIIGQPFPWK